MKKQLGCAPNGVCMLIVTLFMLVNTVHLNAQQHISLNSYSNQTEINAAGSVSLMAGFHVPLGKTVRIFTGASFLQCIPFAGVPSSNQNYVSTRVFKVGGVNTNNIDTARTACQVNQSIQYFDGLGRLMQTVSVQGSPTFRDMVQPVAYDAFGRERYKYLPYVSALASSNGSFKTEAITAQSDFYNNPTMQSAVGVKAIPGSAFAETRFESSPLNRVLEQGASGEEWQLNAGHTLKQEYSTNNTSTAYSTTGFAVRLYHGGTTLSGIGYYGANQLSLTISKDENWKSTDVKAGTVEEYKDKQGRVVLKRTFTTTETLSTYYVYDELGNLSFVLPPGANPDALVVPDQTKLDNYCYQYRYDGRNRMIGKKVPGKGWEDFIYNKLDQVVFSRDAVQAAKAIPEWVFTKYDAFGRVIITGIYAATYSIPTLNAALYGNATICETRTSSGIGYSNNAFPQTFNNYLTVNYYDNYDFPGNTFGQPNTSLGQVPAAKTKGLQTGSLVYIPGTSTKYLSVNYYNEEGWVVQSKTENHLGGKDITDNTYSFSGELTSSTRTHTASPTGPATTISNRFEYDHMGRKLATFEDINGNGEVVLSKLTYNEVGQLLKKELHSENGTSFLQNTTYAYNERGWLKSNISNQFSFQLNYNDANGATSQYNGNISNQLWSLSGTPSGNKFNYEYDPLNRLKSASSPGLTEVITYDIMGNINTLSRNGGAANQYRYTGNRLNTVDNVTTMAYEYDANGNAKKDGRTGMNLTYNLLNLPATASKTGVNVSYIYDAAGRKLSKTSIVGANTTTRNYIDGIEYNGNSIELIHTEAGIARNNAGTYSYEYNLTDHLGNVRYSFRKNPSSQLLERLQSDDYYAFGKRKSSGSPVSLNNKYLYNGKELQDELSSLNEDGQYDYGARFYDPVIGRWNVIDPLAEKFYGVNPYNYTDNNPVNNIDPDGLETYYGQEARDKFRELQSQLSSEETNGDPEKKRGVGQSYIDGLTAQITGIKAVWNDPSLLGSMLEPEALLQNSLDGVTFGMASGFRRALSFAKTASAEGLGSALAEYAGEKTFEGATSLTTAGVGKVLGVIGKAAKTVSNNSKVLLNTSRQLQAKFKHAGDFGVVGNYSKANAANFSSALNQHINASGTQIIQGAYRNANNPVTFYINTQKGLNVIASPLGYFISGAALSPAQVQGILTKGFLW